MTLPSVTRAPRSSPDHYEEHIRLAQLVDWDRPRGIVNYKMGTTNGGSLAISTPVTILQLTSVALKTARLYLISYLVRAFQPTTQGYMRGLLYINTGAGDTLLHGSHVYLPPTNSPYQHLKFATLWTTASDVTATVKLIIDSNVGGSYWTDRGGHLKVEDIGPDRGGQ